MAILNAKIFKYQADELQHAARTVVCQSLGKSPIKLDIPLLIDQHFVLHLSIRTRSDTLGNIMMSTLTYDDVPIAHGWSKRPETFDMSNGGGKFNLLDVGGNTYTVIVNVIDSSPSLFKGQHVLSLSNEFIRQWDQIRELCYTGNIIDAKDKDTSNVSVPFLPFFTEGGLNNGDLLNSVQFVVDRLSPNEIHDGFEPYTVSVLMIDSGIVFAKSTPFYIPADTNPFDSLPMQVQMKTALSESITPKEWMECFMVNNITCGVYPNDFEITITKNEDD